MDLPFHGNSKIIDKAKPLSAEQVNEFVRELLLMEEISGFSVLGFSIGAKLVFQLIVSQKHEIKDVILIAPDGIKPNFWYNLATGSELMRSVFKNIVSNSNRVVSLISLARKLKIIDIKTANFAIKTVKNRDQNTKVYDTWCYLRNLKSGRHELVEIINHSRLNMIFIGEAVIISQFRQNANDRKTCEEENRTDDIWFTDFSGYCFHSFIFPFYKEDSVAKSGYPPMPFLIHIHTLPAVCAITY